MHPVYGILLKVLSAFILSVMVALVKMVAEHVPTGQIIFFRAFFAMLPIGVMLFMRGERLAALRTRHPGKHLARTLIGCVAMGLWFTSLQLLPLPDAMAISYAAPLITTALAALFLGEIVRIYRWSAVIAGFCGILVILYPHFAGSETSDLAQSARLGAITAFLSACCFAATQVINRHMVQTETTAAMVFYMSLAATLVGLATMPFGWVMPEPHILVALVCIGLLGGVGQLVLIQAYRYADVSMIAPFDYTTMLWTILFGWYLFNEAPTTLVIAGTAIVVASGVFVIYRESRLGIERSKAKSVRAQT